MAGDRGRGEVEDGGNGGATDNDGGSDSDGSRSDDVAVESHPIDGTALLKTAALASVPSDRLPALLIRVQSGLVPGIDEYRRRYERIARDVDREAFLVESDHWKGVADRLDLADRERDAAARAHETAVERWGSETGRRNEFETALEIRAAVVIGVPSCE